MTLPSSLRGLSLSCALLGALGLGGCGDSDSSTLVASDVPAAGVAGDAPAPAADAAPAAPALDPGTVLVTVNGQDITQGDFDRVLGEYLRGGMARMPADKLAQMRLQLKDQIESRLIMEKLMDEAVIAEGTQATDAEVEAELARQSKRLPPGMTLESALAQQGMTREELDERLRSFLGSKKLLAKVDGMDPVSDEQARAYYEEHIADYQTKEKVSARHILLMTENLSDEDKAKKKAELAKIRADLVAKNGEGFAEAAKQHSGCPSSSDGGSLGMFGRGQMVPEFDEVAFTLPKGQVSDIVETQFGYHILLVDERKEAGPRPFEEVEEQIKTKVAALNAVSVDEARAYYDQNLLEYQTPENVEARHILFRTDASTPKEKIEKKKEIDALREKLVAAKGEGFAEAAAKHSACPSGKDGGSLGSFGRGQMVPEFDKMAFELPVGELSPVIETQFGYHIILVDKKTEAGTRPFDEVVTPIRLKLASEKSVAAMEAYREGLKKKATIVRHDTGTGPVPELPTLPDTGGGK